VVVAASIAEGRVSLCFAARGGNSCDSMQSARIVLALALALAVPARAAPPPAIVLVGAEDGCPSRSAVAAALRAVFSDLVIDAEGRAEELRVELSDDGSEFRVAAGASERVFTDGTFGCDERARKAAVFIALVLEPPAVADAAPRPHSGAITPQTRGLELTLEGGGRLEGAPGAHLEPAVAAGAQLQLAAGNRYVAGVVGVAALSPVTLVFASARARMQRIPLHASVRGRLPMGRLALSLEAGLALSIQLTEGVDVMSSLSQARLGVGIRVAAQLDVQLWRRIGLFAAVQLEWLANPNNLVLPSAGIVGMTPEYWLAGVVGASVRLR
jgi:hypothetical protein